MGVDNNLSHFTGRCGDCAVLLLLLLSGFCAAAEPENRELASGSATIANANDYVIGPGDQLRIFVLRNPELSADVPVRPDGKISTPLVSDMLAVGKTPAQLGKDLELALQEYVRTPTVTVVVLTPTSTFSQIQVVGQAVTPRAIPYRKGLRVLDVMIQVGGLSQFAAGNRAKVVREVGGHKQELPVRLNDLMNKGDRTQNLELRPGDLLVIPESRF